MKKVIFYTMFLGFNVFALNAVCWPWTKKNNKVKRIKKNKVRPRFYTSPYYYGREDTFSFIFMTNDEEVKQERLKKFLLNRNSELYKKIVNDEELLSIFILVANRCDRTRQRSYNISKGWLKMDLENGYIANHPNPITKARLQLDFSDKILDDIVEMVYN